MPKKADGVSKLVAQAVINRDGMSCQVRVTHAGYAVPYTQIHHRHPRIMGGTRIDWVNQPANLLAICDACHIWVESYRQLAEWHGWLVIHSEIASDKPVFLAGKWFLLDDDGGLTSCAAPAAMSSSTT